MQLMSLGLFAFTLPTALYDELARQIAWRHPDTPRVGARPASQFAGLGEETVTLKGALVPEIGQDRFAIEDLRAMGDEGEARPLVDGDGRVFGWFVITGLTDTWTSLVAGGAARKTDFTLTLKRVDDA